MVGVPRSKGCTLCVQRRVRCDEHRPTCGNCDKYGVTCPGYERGIKFVKEKHTVKSRRNVTKQAADKFLVLDFSTSTLTPSTTALVSIREPEKAPTGRLHDPFVNTCSFNDGVDETRESTRGSTDTPDEAIVHCEPTDPRFASVPGQLRVAPRPFVQNILETLFAINPQHEIVLYAPWFSSVLDHLGKKALLDGAMCAFAMHLTGKAVCSDIQISRSKELYCQALGNLQRSLNHPTESKSMETLCATMLMCNFELFAGTAHSTSWMLHAAGVSRLVQHRGPKSFKTPFEQALLLTFRPLIISDCIWGGKDCFLAKKPWRRLLTSLAAEAASGPTDSLSRVSGHFNGASNDMAASAMPSAKSQPALSPSSSPRSSGLAVVSPLARNVIYFADEHFQNLALMPSILHRAMLMRDQVAHNLTPDPEDVSRLSAEIVALHRAESKWYERFSTVLGVPTEVPSMDPTSPFQWVLRYSNPWLGSIYCNYWAFMIMLQEGMNLTQKTRDWRSLNTLYALNICRSTETIGQGLMGSYRISMGLRIAFEVVDLPTQKWILGVMDKASKHYAACSTETYPEASAEYDPLSTVPSTVDFVRY